MSALVPGDIVNRAAKQLGNSMTVVNFQADQGLVASTARVYYESALKEILRDFDWPFAKVQEQMILLSEHYSLERRFAYLYPPNCIYIQRLFSPWGFDRNPDVETAEKFVTLTIQNPTDGVPVPGFGQGPVPVFPFQGPPAGPPPPGGPRQMVKAILADKPNLWIEYTGNNQVVADYPDDFIAAFVFKLAFYMAPALTGGDPYKLGARAQAEYNQMVQTAAMHAFNEQEQDPTPLGEFMRVRREMGPHGQHGLPGNSVFPSGFSVL